MNLCFDICACVAVLPKLTMQEIKLTQGRAGARAGAGVIVAIVAQHPCR